MVEISRKSTNISHHFPSMGANVRPSRYQQQMSTRPPNEFVRRKSLPPNCAQGMYTKKLPISFVTAQDWKFYIRFSNKVRMRGHMKPRNRVYRLLNSFFRLYQEYAFVCDNILPSHILRTEKNIENETGKEINICKKYCGENKEETAHSFFDRGLDRDVYDVYEDGQLKRWITNKLRYFRKIKYNCTVPYDKIKPFQNETIEIYSNEKMQSLIRHKISFTGFDSLGRPKIKWIQVPIALELLIPKVQSKIQRVMSSCNFLYDPLEVVAELRYFNYSVEMCISHFNETRKFRDILVRLLPPKSQLNELESNPELWLKLQNFHEKMKGQKIENSENVKTEFVYDSHNNTNDNSSKYNLGDHIIKKRFDKLSSERFNTPMQSKLIKIVCSVEKLKLSKVDILEFLAKWKSKYNKQIAEYSQMIIYITESLKDFLMTEEQRGRVLHLLKQNDELKLKLKDEEKKRKSIYNMMQDHLGNVRVYCRCRAVDKNQTVLSIKGNDTIMIKSGLCEEYKFDKVFEPFRTQSDIYEEIQPLILSFIDGFNVCFITYGSEASGKTYTLLGPLLSTSESSDIGKHDGIMKRALLEVLLEQSLRLRDWEYRLTGSIVEIYNDSYTDMLAERTSIHLPIDGGLETVQDTLKTMPIDCEGDIESLIKVCKMKRKVGRTALNPQSSRSHLITIIHLTGKSKIHGENISSFLGLCDLAGFEDILKAETHNNNTLSKEAGYINKSLTAFNRMFISLRRQDPNSVSYRDTKLTYLLKPFLTNQGKCILIVTVRTDKSSISSTQSTLRFGRESRCVALGKVKRQSNVEKIIF